MQHPSTYKGHTGDLTPFFIRFPKLKEECEKIQKALKTSDTPNKYVDDHSYHLRTHDWIILVVQVWKKDRSDTNYEEHALQIEGDQWNLLKEICISEPDDEEMCVWNKTNESLDETYKYKKCWVTGHASSHGQVCKNRFYVNEDGLVHLSRSTRGHNLNEGTRDRLRNGIVLVQNCSWFRTDINVCLTLERFLSEDFSASPVPAAE